MTRVAIVLVAFALVKFLLPERKSFIDDEVACRAIHKQLVALPHLVVAVDPFAVRRDEIASKAILARHLRRAWLDGGRATNAESTFVVAAIVTVDDRVARVALAWL